MEKIVLYRYLGTNGIIDSPVHLEDVYYVRMLDLAADKGKLLTDGTTVKKHVRIPEDDLDLWYEIAEEDK